MNANNLSNTALLLSMPRSGSTLLSLMLGSHPEICCPPEPWIVLALAEHLDLGGVRAMPYGRQLAEIAAFEFMLGPERTQRGALWEALSPLLHSYSNRADDVAPQLLHALYNMHLTVSGRRIFIDKTPRYYAVLKLLDTLLPAARKLLLLRNPLNVFASYKSTWEVDRSVFIPATATVHGRDFCQGLFLYAELMEARRGDVLPLRYEDLVAAPEPELERAAGFLGLDFHRAMLEYGSNAPLLEEYKRSPVGDTSAPGRPRVASPAEASSWEQRLDIADLTELAAVLGAGIFERLGYGAVPGRLRELGVEIPGEAAAAQRRADILGALSLQQEQAFSSADTFLTPLRNSHEDRAERLKVILRQQEELQAAYQAKHSIQAELDEARDKIAALEVQNAELLSIAGFLRNRINLLWPSRQGHAKKP